MNYHSKNKDEIIKKLKSSIEGLSSEEANKRLKQYGKNTLPEKKGKSVFQKIIEQIKDPMVIILLLATIISFVVKMIEKNYSELYEPLLILIIVIVNAIFGIIQEGKAEKALELLKSTSIIKAKVLRDNKEVLIDSDLLVPGDIIRLEAGDYVPADSRLLKSTNLKSEESSLTGESLPVDKNSDAVIPENSALGDRINMLYSGCSITFGSCVAIVTSTGANTEIGKIANLLSEDNMRQTPLQNKLTKLSKYLGVAAIFICLIILIVGLINNIHPIEIFTVAVSLAVSAIPEGMPAIVTVILSLGVQRLAKRKSIVRKLLAVETLGNASIICSDKTGTLTQNQMTVTLAYTSKTNTSEQINEKNSWAIRKMLTFATLCTDGNVNYDENGIMESIGDPTETSIIVAAHKNGFSKTELVKNYPRIAEIPFDSDRKLMTTIHNIDGTYTVIVKGSFDSIAKICDESQKEKVELAKLANKSMSESALRVIAVATKDLDSLPETINQETIENDLILLGLIGMIDPPRDEAKLAVAECRKAGIKPIMITGDHIATASAIAKSLDIMHDNDIAITGTELDLLSEEELDSKIENISVYARVSPENKIRIVKSWQQKGHVVAMTGDGVNDAPALKAADIGCAMGITGTDVAKGAADIILTDDNFSTIVSAIKEGRGIYDNIKKVIGYLLGTNIGEIVVVFLCMMLWHISPLLSMQLLWINLITDSLPAIALGMEKIDNDIMSRKPMPKNSSIFSNNYGLVIILQGFMFGILSLLAFYFGKKYSSSITTARTMTFIVLSLSQTLQVFNMRSNKSIFKIGFFTNKSINKATLLSILLTMIILFTPLCNIFGLQIMNIEFYIISIILSIIPLILTEIVKFIKNKGFN